jgi:hypothetical protein
MCARHLYARDAGDMSAIPPITTELMQRRELSRCANREACVYRHRCARRPHKEIDADAVWHGPAAPSRAVAAAAQSPALRELIVRYNDVLLAQVQQSVACNALHGLEARLCRWLLQTHDCIDGNVIPLTQEFLGQMLGVRRTTVTIAARLLHSAGLIRYRRGLIHIIDRAALEDIACECYAVVKHNADKVFAARPPLR